MSEPYLDPTYRPTMAALASNALYYPPYHAHTSPSLNYNYSNVGNNYQTVGSVANYGDYQNFNPCLDVRDFTDKRQFVLPTPFPEPLQTVLNQAPPPVPPHSAKRTKSTKSTSKESDLKNETSSFPLKMVGEYVIKQTLGQGTFGKVKLAEHYITKEQVAIKIIQKSNVKTPKQKNSVQREIRLMKLLHHPHIVQVYNIEETEEYIFIIMEYANGGELFDYIVKCGSVKEVEARRFFRMVLSAVAYCHLNSIIHRDLKPENLLLNKNKEIKIIDFGFGNTYHRERTLDTFCGSPFYAAPEMIKGIKYIGPEVDIWSLGVILFALLSGRLPFDANTMPELYDKIARGAFTVPESFSPDATHLISRMLTVDPKQRATLDEVMVHPFINEGYPTLVETYLPPRPPVVYTPNAHVLSELASFGIPEHETIRLLSYNSGLQPITSLYHLVNDARLRLERQQQQHFLQQLVNYSNQRQDTFIEEDGRRCGVYIPPPPPRAVRKGPDFGAQQQQLESQTTIFEQSEVNLDMLESTKAQFNELNLSESASCDRNLNGGLYLESIVENARVFKTDAAFDMSLDELITALIYALQQIGFGFIRKDENTYVCEEPKGRSSSDTRIKIEIEILEAEAGYEIKMKRLNGNALKYKKIYSYPNNPRVAKAVIAAKYNGFEIEQVTVQLGVDNKTPEFLAKFPLGKVPTFESADGKLCLYESNAIAHYVASLKDGLLGSTKEEAALIQQWVVLSDNEIAPAAAAWLYPILGYIPLNDANTKNAKENVKKLLTVLDHHLLTRTYFVGESITMADITLACSLLPFYRLVFEPEFRAPYKNVNRWFVTIINQANVKSVIGDVQLCEKMAVAEHKKAEKKAEKPKEEKPTKEEKKKDKKKKDDDEEEEEDYRTAEEKPQGKNPLDLLPPSTLNLEEWKRFYSNNDTRPAAVNWFWERFDPEGFSIYKVNYKYNSELTLTFMSSNLIGGFFQRLERARKYAFGSMLVLGTDNANEISGYFVFRGTGIPAEVQEAADFESYTFTKVDPKDEKVREEYAAYIAWDEKIEGKPFVDGKVFK
ncbi:Elongation factor 1-gamma [Nowakowskiella sp. JEL0407]|nr:Elongation factor 1-gamma [Nowakowskiella sp. JEL0407]